MRQKVRRHGDVAHAGLAPCDGLHTTICGTMPEQSYRLLRPVRTSKLMSRADSAKREATTTSCEFCQRLHEEAVRWLLLRQVGIGTTLIDRPVCNSHYKTQGQNRMIRATSKMLLVSMLCIPCIPPCPAQSALGGAAKSHNFIGGPISPTNPVVPTGRGEKTKIGRAVPRPAKR